jgi:hypothetical protein
VYALPFGAGHSRGSGNPIVKFLVSDWRISGIVTVTSGAPLGFTSSSCNLPGVTGTCIASYNPAFNGPVRINGEYGSGNALNPGAVAYFDKNAFLTPAAYTFGNLPRSGAYGLYAPHILSEDLSLKREFAIRESIRFAIAADAFNVTNSVHFAAPGTAIDSANFGQVTTSNPPRKLQLNARITF